VGKIFSRMALNATRYGVIADVTELLHMWRDNDEPAYLDRAIKLLEESR